MLYQLSYTPKAGRWYGAASAKSRGVDAIPENSQVFVFQTVHSHFTGLKQDLAASKTVSSTDRHGPRSRD